MFPLASLAAGLCRFALRSRLMAARRCPNIQTLLISTIYVYFQALDRMLALKDERWSGTNALVNGSLSLLRARFVFHTE